MTEDFKVLLIQPPSPRINFTIPLGLAYLAAVIKREGLRVRVIDATAPYSHWGINQILKEVSKFKPQLIGINVNTLFAGFAYDLIKALKKFDLTILVGGAHATLLSHEVLLQGADIAVRGEAEETIKELIYFYQNKNSLGNIKGISFFEAGKIRDNPPRDFLENLDVLPFPAKDAFDISAYAKNDFELWRFGGLVTSRGCIGRCSFCSREVFGNKYRVRSNENVLEEIIFLNQKYGLKDFYFLDDIFTAERRRIFSLCECLREKLNFNFSFSCITRFDRIDRELLLIMRQAGCRAINYGVESANPTTLKKINKVETIEEMVEKTYLTKELGINCSINFMWGYPWEKDAEIKNTVSLIKKLSKDVSEIMPGGVLIPFPGTELYEQNKHRYNLENWWLDRNRFTGSYRKDNRVLLFRHYLFDDQGQFEDGGFFDISNESLSKIKQVARFISWHNLRIKHNLFGSISIFFICELSSLLYNINHNLGYLYSKLILNIIKIKNQIGRKDILKNLK